MKKSYLKGFILASCLIFAQTQTVNIEGDITSNTTWTSDQVYFLNNQAFVNPGVTLTIEAGTTIYGRYDANYSAENPAPCLVIEQGGKIMAEGTADNPITFRSELNPSDPNYGSGRGLWGGLIINGYAPISNEGGTANVEGLTGVVYGGNNPDDNSGVLRYVRVWNGGSAIAADNEINGITLAGVGRGTTVEFCEVALNMDDGFELFGGTVDLKHCAVINVGDDGFDTDNGYQGRGQFLFVLRANDSDKAQEMDNKTNGDLDSQPRSHPQFANVTILGGLENVLRLREGTGGDFRNYIMVGGSDGVRNDDNGSEMVTQNFAAAEAFGYPNYLYLSENMLMHGLSGTPFKDFNQEGETFTNLYIDADPGVSFSIDELTGFATYVETRPVANGPAYENLDVVLEDDFFTQVAYKGAFGSEQWLAGWSWLDENNILETQPLSIDSHFDGTLPQEITLQGNYPNPFNPVTQIKLGLNRPSMVRITIYNLNGQEVDQINIQHLSAGYHSIPWQPINVSSGNYFYSIQAGNEIQYRKMTFLK